MKKQKKISLLDADCIELLSYEDRIFVALFKKDFTLCMWSDRRDAYDIWALMDCSGNTSLLRQYLLGKTSLHALFNKCKVTKAYEYHDAWFELVPQKDDVSAELVEPYPDVYLRCKGIDVDALVPRNCEYMPWHYVKKIICHIPICKDVFS